MSDITKIKSTNPVYNENIDTWSKCRDAFIGQDAIKRGKETYLPKGNGMQIDDYEIYLNRAVYYNATKRTVDGLKGAMFRKDPVTDVPKDFEDIYNNIGFGGLSAIDIAQELAEETIITSRVGLLVDYPASTPEQVELISKAEAERLGKRPYMSIYRTESIINWKFDYVDNGVRLTMVVLKETVEQKKNDMFDIEYISQYRALYLDEEGYYTQRVYSDEQTPPLDQNFQPMVNGQKLTFIPFWICTPQGNEYREIVPPVIKDLADMNVAHYVNSADREQELYWAGVKMYVFPGWEDTEKPPKIGKPISAPVDCKPLVLESSAGSDIQEEMTKKEERMSVLGSQIISGRGRYVASATTAEISQSGEESILASIAKSISRVMQDALNFSYDWYRGNISLDSQAIQFQLNEDFNSKKLMGAELTSLVMAWQAKAFSYKTLFQNLKDGEIIEPEKTVEDEQKEIEENPPSDPLLDGIIDDEPLEDDNDE